jgi:hypothetical protein
MKYTLRHSAVRNFVISVVMAFSIVAPAASILNPVAPQANAAAVCKIPIHTTRKATTTPVASVPISSYSMTDGDILAGAAYNISTKSYLAIGGNFDNIVLASGQKVPAQNFAILDGTSGAVVFAGKNINSFVYSISQRGNTVYAGGSFTTFNGVARKYIAAVNATNGALTSWNPGATSKVVAIAAGSSNIYYAGGHVRAVDTTGKSVWTATVVGGPVRALLLSPGQTGLYVAGLFEQVAGYNRHGLMELTAATGKAITGFTPTLRADSGVGEKGDWDGEEGLALAWDGSYSPQRLILGYGGAKNNGTASINAATGSGYWNRAVEGDVQAVGKAGTTYIAGYHRSHGNNIGCPYPFFGTSYDAQEGAIQSYWNPKLSGFQSNEDGGNNGIQAMAINESLKRVYLLGAFTKYGGTCDANMVACTGGTPRQSIAVYIYN